MQEKHGGRGRERALERERKGERGDDSSEARRPRGRRRRGREKEESGGYTVRPRSEPATSAATRTEGRKSRLSLISGRPERGGLASSSSPGVGQRRKREMAVRENCDGTSGGESARERKAESQEREREKEGERSPESSERDRERERSYVYPRTYSLVGACVSCAPSSPWRANREGKWPRRGGTTETDAARR